MTMNNDITFLSGGKFGGSILWDKPDGSQEIVFVPMDLGAKIEGKRYFYNQHDDTYTIEDIDE